MSRPLRIQYPGAVYHVMNRGTARQAIFLNHEDYDGFVKTVAEAHRRWGIEVFAYCLMRNHYHFCLRTPGGNLARVMRHIDGLYTQRFNRTHGRDGPLFRGRYKAILVDADAYLAAVVRYIHLNPVGAGVVKMPEEYAWSSQNLYLKKNKPEWLKTQELLEPLGGIKAFQKFIHSGNEVELETFYRSGRQSPVLGDEPFVQRVKEGVDKLLTREHPRYERVRLQVAPEDVMRTVAGLYRVGVERLIKGQRGTENEARKVAMYLVRRCCDRTLQETARLFGVGSYGAVGWACHGIEAKLKEDSKLSDRIERIERAIYQQKI
jgi:REP element-mobilizing transposase RayT